MMTKATEIVDNFMNKLSGENKEHTLKLALAYAKAFGTCWPLLSDENKQLVLELSRE